MNMSIAWTIWFLVSLAVFAALESYALSTGRETLSEFVRYLSVEWGPFPWICGIVIGGLAAHFWWKV